MVTRCIHPDAGARYPSMADMLAELEQRYPGRIEAAAGPLAEWRLFGEMERARESGEPIPGAVEALAPA